MSVHKENFLNRLVSDLPEGLPVTGRWLRENIGCSRQLLQMYVKNNWLDNPCRGIYVRKQAAMSFLSALLSIQTVIQRDCQPAGISALRLLGYTQYLSPGKNHHFILRGTASPPKWLANLNLPNTFEYKGRQLFSQNRIGFTEYPLHGFSDTLNISALERAWLELLADVNDESSFTTAYELFEGMTAMNPHLLHTLLSECKNMKVKRVFFLMLERAGHNWRMKLDVNNYDLGRGKRHIITGGRLNRKYEITVPEGFND